MCELCCSYSGIDVYEYIVELFECFLSLKACVLFLDFVSKESLNEHVVECVYCEMTILKEVLGKCIKSECSLVLWNIQIKVKSSLK